MKHVICLLALAAAGQALAQSSVKQQEPAPPEIPSLQDQLDARKEAFAKKAPKDLKEAFAQGLREVAESGVLERAKQVGAKAPDFTLPNAAGGEVSLYRLLEAGPVVITWYRGGWCPYCNIQLRAMQQVLPQLKQAGANLVAISPEKPDHALNTVQKESLDFHVLSDVGNKVARQYGVVYGLPEAVAAKFKGMIDLAAYQGEAHAGQLPLSATYVVNQAGEITYAFLDADYKKRAEPAEILEHVRELDTAP